MAKKTINIVLITVGTIAFLAFFWWLSADPTSDFTVSLEGADNRGEGNAYVQDVDIGELFVEYTDDYVELNETWPNFRGPDMDNISKSPIKLIENLSAEGPKILWSVEMGEGHSGAAIYKGLAYVLDYDEEERADRLRCFSLVDGTEQWSRGYDVAIKRNHGCHEPSRRLPRIIL